MRGKIYIDEEAILIVSKLMIIVEGNVKPY